LPSEDDWYFVCRAGTKTPFYFGETITTELVNFDDKKTKPLGTKPVGSFPPNAFGLYDMHGNVWEWCEDVYNDNYINAPTNGRPWLIGSENYMRLARGGSWENLASSCRSAVRNTFTRASNYWIAGFRVVAVAVA
ncbi:MAG: formylglycine-generating enzyme family protein, partial [Nostoc sp.]